MNTTLVGKQFEHLVGKLYSEMGYDVEVGKIIKGRSGADYETDVFFHRKSFWRGEKNGIVECKYRDDKNCVGRSDLADFLLLLDDVKVDEAHLVTNSYFADSVLMIADRYNIKMVDGSGLKKLLDKYNLSTYIEHFPDNPLSFVAKSFFDIAETVGIIKTNKKNDVSTGFSFFDKNTPQPVEQPNMKDNELDISSLVNVEIPKVMFDEDIGGLEEVKNDLKLSVINQMKFTKAYELLDKEPSSVLLYGPPGCGKTLIAKAIATEFGGQFMAPYVHDVMKRYVGESEEIVSKIFEYCRKSNKSTVLFFDELDALVPRGGPQYVKRIKNEFLTQMGGLSARRGHPIVIGASNKPWLIDIAIRRPGRFDDLIMIPQPDILERKQVLRVHMRNLVLKDMIDDDYIDIVDYLANKTEGWSSADLKALVEDAKKGPLRDLHSDSDPVRKVVRSDFDTALSKRNPTVNSWYFEAIQGCRHFKENEILEDIMKHLPSSIKKEQTITAKELV
jgi:transitional endoplasmic reticulum ATPase